MTPPVFYASPGIAVLLVPEHGHLRFVVVRGDSDDPRYWAEVQGASASTALRADLPEEKQLYAAELIHALLAPFVLLGRTELRWLTAAAGIEESDLE